MKNKIILMLICEIAIVVSVSLLTFILLIAMNNYTEARSNFYCNYLKLNVANNIIDDIERQQEHKDLCTTEECKISFDERVNKSFETLNKVTSYDCSVWLDD